MSGFAIRTPLLGLPGSSARRLVVSVDGRVVREVDELRLDRSGRVALWVGDGTRAHFADLRITPRYRNGG